MKVINSIVLSEIATRQFNNAAYGLDNPEQNGVLQDDQVINHLLEEVDAFETIMDGETITSWLAANMPVEYEKYRKENY